MKIIRCKLMWMITMLVSLGGCVLGDLGKGLGDIFKGIKLPGL